MYAQRQDLEWPNDNDRPHRTELEKPGVMMMHQSLRLRYRPRCLSLCLCPCRKEISTADAQQLA